ncbi:type II secretion system protein [Streptomyces sp. SID13031]|uniref:type IV pilus modification PilV family protein n=1 Tax=Streptomyces sp. SID13031 TaxID=2706046 RepID=UPI0013C7A9DD|nr:type II secretion system protein [Streptomyces sp. SID13031]NEA32326.1 type II secretion system protein [Streptomyces sp. SID13031]
MRGGSAERGESLLELVVAIALMGVAIVAVMSGLTTTVLLSDVQRKEATASSAVRAYAEALQQFVASGHYVACASAGSYAVPGFTPPAGFTARIVAGSVRYWAGALWLPLCLPDRGLQKLRVSVESTDGRASEYLDVVLRKPCGVEDPPCS